MNRTLDQTAALLGFKPRAFRSKLRECGLLDTTNQVASAHRERGYLFSDPRSCWNETLKRYNHYAVALLEALPVVSIELAEVFRCVDAVIGDEHIAYVTPIKCPEYPYGAVISDASGNLLAAAKGKSKEALAELIRLKLLPSNEGYGEVEK